MNARTCHGSVPLVATIVVAVVASVAACGSAGPSFSTSGPCLADGRAPGAYPVLESDVPHAISGRAATSVDSGRNCSADALGSFVKHGVDEIDFAGATWDEGGGSGVSIAVLSRPDGPLPIIWAEEFYRAGAEAGSKTSNVQVTTPTYPGAGKVFRLDTLNDLSYQSVVVWADGSLARVVIVATQVGPNASMSVHDARVVEAVGAAVLAEQHSPGANATGPVGSPGPEASAGSGASEPVLPSPS